MRNSAGASMDLNELASFVRVVEHGSITGAAEVEGVPKSTISRRVRRLEEDLGAELLRRSARSFTVTADGQRLYERARGALEEMEQAATDLTDEAGKPHGRLILTAPHDIGRARFILDVLAEYRRRYPAVQIELRAEQRVVDLVNEGVDVALRAFRGAVPGGDGLMVRELSTTAARWYASPDYLEGRPPPTLPDLRGHDLIVHTAFRAVLEDFSTRDEPILVDSPVVEANDLEVVRALIERGLGIGVLPEFTAREGFERGRLVPILTDFGSSAGKFALVWPASRHLAPRVRAFVDLVNELLGSTTWTQ